MFSALPRLAMFAVLLVATGCVGPTRQPFRWQDDTVALAWPEPPDAPRVGYLRSLTGPADFAASGRGSALLTWLFGERQPDVPLISPFAVASGRPGVFWVADIGAHMLYRIDVDRGNVGYIREAAGEPLELPSGVAVDAARGRVFLADAGRGKVFVLDEEGKFLGSREPEGGFGLPAGMALDAGGRLLVADATAGVIHVFDVDGRPISPIGSRSSEGGRFARPVAVAIGPHGEVLVLDAFSFRIEVQSADGALLGTIGRLGDAAGGLARPKGLAVDPDGHVFVSDAAFDNIQVFDMAGNLLMFWGKAGRTPGRFSLPAGLFVDHERRLFVADSYNHRIQVFQLLQ